MKTATDARQPENLTGRTENRHRALGRNVLLKNVAETSRLFQIAFFVVVARRFGPSGLGQLTLLLMVGSVVGLVFGDMGINTLTIAKMNAATDKKRDKVTSTAILWKAVLSMVSLLLVVVAIRLGVRSGTWSEALAVGVISVGGLWLEFLSALTNGVNRLGAEAKLRHAYRATVYGGGAALAFFLGLPGVLIFMAAATAAVLSVGFVLVQSRVLHATITFGHAADPSFLKQASPIWVAQVAQLTYLKLDVVILGFLHIAAKQIGWYAAGWKIVDVLTVVPALLAGAALPLISGALPRADASAIAPAYLRAMYVLPFFLVLPLAVGAAPLAQTLYGRAFSGTSETLSILAWVLAPFCVHTFLVTLAVAKGRQMEAAKLGAATAVLGLLAAFALVPQLGYQAMATVSLAANSLFALGMVYRFRDATNSAHAGLGIRCLAGALGVYAISLTLAGHVPALALALAAALAYGLILLPLKVVTFRDVGRGWRLLASLVSAGSFSGAGAA